MTSRSTSSVLIATLVVIGVALVGPASALPQQTALSQQTAAYQAPPDVKAPPADAEKSKTGLATKVITPGTGTEHPTPADRVTVHYTGWTTDGKMFDSSFARGKPSTFPLGSVLTGWTEGVQLMVIGEKRRMWMPEKLAFKGADGRPRGMVVFDIELLEIRAGPEGAARRRGAAGRRGQDEVRPVLEGDQGRHRDRSPDQEQQGHRPLHGLDDRRQDVRQLGRARPAGAVPARSGHPRLDRGLQLMTEGETRRLWIPEKLAYRGEDGKPKGMLVFDVELIAFQK